MIKLFAITNCGSKLDHSNFLFKLSEVRLISFVLSKRIYKQKYDDDYWVDRRDDRTNDQEVVGSNPSTAYWMLAIT